MWATPPDLGAQRSIPLLRCVQRARSGARAASAPPVTACVGARELPVGTSAQVCPGGSWFSRRDEVYVCGVRSSGRDGGCLE